MSATPDPKTVLVAGAGIGGLAAALGLAKSGWRVAVLEKAPALGEIGAGIQLGPNAFHALDWLGVGDAARAIAIYIDSLRLMDALSGEELARIPLEEPFRKRFGNPYAVIHRGDLHGIFLAAVRAHPNVLLRTRAEVVDYHQDERGVVVRLASGETLEGAGLVGADGLWSSVRRNVVGDGPPRVSGHTTYRSVIPTKDMPADLRWNAATLWAGPKLHIVHYPLSDWKAFNLVVTCHDDAPEPVAGQPVAAGEVAAAFASVGPRARRIIEGGRDWKRWVLCDREPVSGWQDGRVVLLGDAAHPMLQYLAQGACMAMEDAVCLADACAASDDLQAAFGVYQRQRSLRTARVQLQSRWVGEHIYHPAGAHAELRNALLRGKRAEDWYDTVEWLYGGSGVASAFGAPAERYGLAAAPAADDGVASTSQ